MLKKSPRFPPLNAIIIVVVVVVVVAVVVVIVVVSSSSVLLSLSLYGSIHKANRLTSIQLHIKQLRNKHKRQMKKALAF